MVGILSTPMTLRGTRTMTRLDKHRSERGDAADGEDFDDDSTTERHDKLIISIGVLIRLNLMYVI